jgi:hypothetical protein
LFIFRCPAGGDDAEALVALRINHAQNLPAAHAKKNYSFLAIGGSFVDPLNAEWIAKSIGGLFKGNAVLAIIRDGLGVIPFKS